MPGPKGSRKSNHGDAPPAPGKRRGMSKRGFLKVAGGAACTLCAAKLGARYLPAQSGEEAARKDAGAAGKAGAPGVGGQPSAESPGAVKGLLRPARSPFFSALDDDVVRCELCPNGCRVSPGERGSCRVRENRGGALYTLVHGNPALLQIDPIERKPFFHVLPGSRSLSVATAGCNIACKFCQVWDMALVSPEEVYAYDFPPERVVAQARENDVASIAYTFGEPVVFYEYMKGIAEKAREEDLKSLLHSNGFINPEPLAALAPLLDAVNIDLKSFDPSFYERVCDGRLEPVKRSLLALRRAGLHIEVTNIVIPTLNDDTELIGRMCKWIKEELGPDTPLHFVRFYPLYKLANLPPTPVSTLDAARNKAREVGLHYVYVGNAPGHAGENTFCPGCDEMIVRRMGFMVEFVKVSDGKCQSCGHEIAGIWGG